MITTDVSGNKVLQIFERFEIDTDLPKHVAKRVAAARAHIPSQDVWSGGMLYANVGIGSSVPTVVMTGGSAPLARPTLTQRLMAKCFRRLTQAAKETWVRARAVPVEDVFQSISGNGKKLEIVEGRLETHKAAIGQAREMGQIALAEQLEERTAMVEAEAILYADGDREFIEEQTLIDFAIKCERGLRLDWLRNFARMLPREARVRKARMDALHAFDSYAVLHFDPEGKAHALTKKEIEKKRDPILFGLVRGSRRLYHVYSWKDEYCDLTFGDLIDKYGREALTLQ